MAAIDDITPHRRADRLAWAARAIVWIQAAIALLLVAVARYFLPESVLRLLDDTMLLDLIAGLGVLVAPPLVTFLTLVSRLPMHSKICQLLATWLLLAVEVFAVLPMAS
jgi:hypothetical protein